MTLLEPNRTFLSVLAGSTVFTTAFPLIVFVGARIANRNGYNYNQEQQQNGQQQQYYDNQYNNDGCRWWQWGCRDNYNYNENNSHDDERDNALPWWWLWSEDERRRDPEDAANPTLVVIYLWTLIMMIGLCYYAYKTVTEYRDLVGLSVSFLMLTNFAIVSMLYLGGLEGGVQDDGRVIEEQGFYGQFGVLLFLTNFFAAVYGATWFYLTRRMIHHASTTTVLVTPDDYMKSSSSPSSAEGGSGNYVAPSGEGLA
jgi:hypothetical protein